MLPDIGEVIRYIREEQGYTRKYFEVCCGINRRTLGRIEDTGLGNIKSVESILRVLGYELEVVPINGRDKLRHAEVLEEQTERSGDENA